VDLIVHLGADHILGRVETDVQGYLFQIVLDPVYLFAERCIGFKTGFVESRCGNVGLCSLLSGRGRTFFNCK